MVSLDDLLKEQLKTFARLENLKLLSKLEELKSEDEDRFIKMVKKSVGNTSRVASFCNERKINESFLELYYNQLSKANESLFTYESNLVKRAEFFGYEVKYEGKYISKILDLTFPTFGDCIMEHQSLFVSLENLKESNNFLKKENVLSDEERIHLEKMIYSTEGVFNDFTDDLTEINRLSMTPGLKKIFKKLCDEESEFWERSICAEDAYISLIQKMGFEVLFQGGYISEIKKSSKVDGFQGSSFS